MRQFANVALRCIVVSMKLSRGTTAKLVALFDGCLPPFIRDSSLLMVPIFKLLFRDKAHFFKEFKGRAHLLTDEQYRSIYKAVAPVCIQRETDISAKCLKAILKNIIGKDVLEVGCGRGYLAGILAHSRNVTAVDMVIEKNLETLYPNVSFRESTVEKLPFLDNSFDTTVTTHTLEHVLNFHDAVKELRRVTKKKLIIVVPAQRPYRYTFDLHVNFFPYPHSFLIAIQAPPQKSSCININGELLYIENF